MAYKCSAFRQGPRQGIHPSKYCPYLPPPPTSGRGPGTWFRGHAPHLKDRGNARGNTCYSCASWNRCLVRGWKAGRAGSDTGGWGAAGRQMLHVITKQTETVHFKYVPLNVLQLYLNKLKKRKEERAGPSPTTSKVHCCPTALGKRVLMRKFN